MSGSIYDDSDPYLSHLKSKGKYEGWMECLRNAHENPLGHIHIVDITALGGTYQWEANADTIALSAELTERELPDGGTRLIIFAPSNRIYVQKHVGAMYDIDPGFFRAVLMSCESDGFYEGVKHRVPEFLVGGRPRHLDLGYGWAGVIHRRGNCNIVLLSASYSSGRLTEHRWYYENNTYLDLVKFHEEYLRALLKLDKQFFIEVHKNPLFLMLPILDIHVAYLYEGLIYADQLFRRGRISRREKPELVEWAWSALRIMKHDGMGPLDCVRQYDSDYNGNKIQEFGQYKKLAERFRCIIEEISRTEALARDYLQHHVGMFGLEESRVSIKQTRAAFEESKRTKLITVLAIFFVPISLSTSVFGMNIHELNENGQSIWVFILTTVLIVAATMILWGFMYQFQKYNSQPRDGIKEGKHWRTRSAALCQLIFRGHIIWAWKSGILVSLLTDGRVAFLMSCAGHRVVRLLSPLLHSPHEPCRYVRVHIGMSDAFDCDKFED
ncbi:hypothetical protein FHL15_008090 [Xylaria flabelliformis]|uniref:Uncharacterized protein n=1 Tax=Xylaria flabelliformis TaxID=2512241 RepID=A0A553HT23_9PEZI|nr:hypothetical protein FHL15_008090 [Xylaria flabelliformis]